MQTKVRTMMATLISTVFFVGRAPFAPGTLGALVSLPLWYFASGAVWFYVVLFFTLLVVAFFSVRIYQNAFSKEDAPEIVIDEFLGLGVAVFSMSQWWEFVAAFCLFRIFDILKPYPISFVDRRFKGPVGVLSDDLIAGILAWCFVKGAAWILNLW